MKKTYHTPELYINLMAKEDIMNVSTNELGLFDSSTPENASKATGDVLSIW